jgi:protein-disulfide isomerase
MNTSFQTAPFASEKKHKTLKTALIVILSILGAIILLFAGLTGFYFYKIKTGGDIELAGLFAPKNNSIQTQSQNVSKIKKNSKSFLRPFNPTKNTGNKKPTIVAFIDYECAYCQQTYKAFSEIIKKYEPVAGVAIKNFPVAEAHENAMNAALAAQCAHDQNLFWPYYDKLFTNKKLDLDSLKTYAAELKLKQSVFEECLSSSKHEKEIAQDMQDGLDLDIQGTPTFFINNIKIQGMISEQEWNKIIMEQIK